MPDDDDHDVSYRVDLARLVDEGVLLGDAREVVRRDVNAVLARPDVDVERQAVGGAEDGGEARERHDADHRVLTTAPPHGEFMQLCTNTHSANAHRALVDC